ncbi:MAG: glycosyltransferase family 4 protein [Isosphaeraceae bacterium]
MRVLALVDSPDHVCCRYRIRAFEPALARAGWSLSYEPLQRNPFSRLPQLAGARHHDAVILQRRLLPQWELRILRKHARYLVFDFDDAVLLRDSYDRRGPRSPRRENRFGAVVRIADAVIAGNDFLADCATRAGAQASRVCTIPTCVEPALYPEASPHRAVGHASSYVDLVWIGSSSTLKGLEQEQPLWNRLGREIPGLRLRLICDRFPKFETLPIVPVPWAREWEAHDLAAGQIGISYLPDDLWSRGKCGLKVLQYQAARLPVVANPVGTQAEMIDPGRTGFLPVTADQWVEAVRTLASDPELRQRMGRLARQHVESAFSVETWSEAFVAAISGTRKLVPVSSSPPRRTESMAVSDPLFLGMKTGHLGSRRAG